MTESTEQLWDSIEEFIPEHQCNDCGSFDVFSEVHDELEGNPKEQFCNKCNGKSIANYRGQIEFEIEELTKSKRVWQSQLRKEIEGLTTYEDATGNDVLVLDDVLNLLQETNSKE